MQHSIRLFEKEHTFSLMTQIVNVIEQPVKIVRESKPVMVTALGLVLAETIFHPQGGGQPADQGTLDGLPLLIVSEDKSQPTEQKNYPVYHFLDPEQSKGRCFDAGQQVHLIVNESFRQQCQRSHTAGHILADIIELDPRFSFYQGQVTRGHHFPGSEFIKVLVKQMPADLPQFIQQINMCLEEMIQANLSITSSYEANNIRHIKVGSSARMCGGTHVKSTQEAAGCKVTRIKAGKTNNDQIELTIFYSC